ncbi:MAG: helix-turn-helix domain-containing protein [Clostridia bacterium]|nr:helix-turn-helix domain-containing protein [Clostridia bacterium]
MIYREEDKDRFVELLSDELPVLRARIKVSQADLARGVGISRQTYSLIETKKQKMSWVTFMAMIAFFSAYPRTRTHLVSLGLIEAE